MEYQRILDPAVVIAMVELLSAEEASELSEYVEAGVHLGMGEHERALVYIKRASG